MSMAEQSQRAKEVQLTQHQLLTAVADLHKHIDQDGGISADRGSLGRHPCGDPDEHQRLLRDEREAWIAYREACTAFNRG